MSVPRGGGGAMVSIKALSSPTTKLVNKFDTEVYEILAGRTALFEMTARGTPKIMAPGDYKASLAYFQVMDKDFRGQSISIPENDSNSVVIIGETSPYITESYDSRTPCKSIVLRGVRFHPTNNTIILTGENGRQEIKNISSRVVGDRMVISLVPSEFNIVPGDYLITITNAEMGPQAGLSSPAYIHFEDYTGPESTLCTGVEDPREGMSDPVPVPVAKNESLIAKIMKRLAGNKDKKPVATPTYTPSPSYSSSPSPQVTPPVIKEPPLVVICDAIPKNVTIGEALKWTSNLICGAAPYSYTWSGTDNLVGFASDSVKSYTTTGVKTARVTVRTKTQTVTAECKVGVMAAAPATSPTQTTTPSPTTSATPAVTSTPSPSYSSTPTPTYSTTPSPTYTSTPTQTSTPSPTQTSTPASSPSSSSSSSSSPTPTGTGHSRAGTSSSVDILDAVF